MLQVHNLHKAYQTALFDGVSFTMTSGERLGLVGRNGSGKTTFFRLVLGEETPDLGTLEVPRRYTVGHLSQQIAFHEDTVLGEASLGLVEKEGGWVETHRAEATLMGLGFTPADFQRSPHELSGGFQVRLQLAKVLLEEPNLLLLDEPTNYLDIVSVRWLRRFLRGWRNELILITHDQDFMNSVTTHTIAIHRRRMRRIKGATTKLYDMIAQEEEIHEKTRANDARARRQTQRFIERFRAKATKARQVQSRIKTLQKKGTLEQLENIANLDFKFNAAPFAGNYLYECENVAFGYVEDEPPLFKGFTLSVAKGDRIGVIGKNGKGKSTLLNVLAGDLEAWDGNMKAHPNMRLAHFGQNNIDRLQPGRTVEDEILTVHPDHDRGAARSICGLMMFEGDDALKNVSILSGGERARVLLGKLLVSPANLLFLDEPSNHLDMESIDSMIEAVAAFPGAALLVTHNERVLHALANRLVIFDRGRARVFEGTYQNFLERLGWSDEDEGRGERVERESKKEQRRRRAEIVAERSRVLKPLKTRMDELEKTVIALEEQLEAVNRDLLEASEKGDREAIVRLSRDLGQLRAAIDRRFEELERVTTEHDAKARELDGRLGE